MSWTWSFPYSSRRMPVLARNVVATSQPLAAQAGLAMLAKGGNAVDAALATAITLTVVEPTSNGIGSDAFAIVWDGSKLHGLNASGKSPAAWTTDHFAAMNSMPTRGWDAVTVPGAVSAWVSLSERFGRVSFSELFQAAIGYARDGFLVSPITAAGWAHTPRLYADFPDFADAFLPGGRAPAAGERFSCAAQAQTLERIAETRGEAFYRGDLSERIAAHARATGGLLTEEDLASHQPDWVETITVDYRGYTVHEIPPNGQGIAALITLGILDRWNLANYPVDSADSLHLQIEAMKLGFADAHRHVADPGHLEIEAGSLLTPAYLDERARLIDMRQAGDPEHGRPQSGGTVYLTAADANGMMVSYIQSNYAGFGSGIVVPETGISLQNRGAGFNLKPGHPNQVGGGKRPFHTIIPTFVTYNGEPFMSYGVMGGPMQPQGHAQVLIRMLDYQQNPQAASDAPRWQVIQGREIALERGTSPQIIEDLRGRGHQVTIAAPEAFGGSQLICRMKDGYCAASDPRKDGQAVGF